jgi:uncharacterized surface protein with fasciclin (FAS1) repeats
VQVASAAPQFSTLVTLVKRAGLVDALSGQTKLTVFAPTNAAFAKVPAKTLRALKHDKAMLKSVLLYHVVKGRLSAKRIANRHSASTLEGGRLHFRTRAGHVYVNRARVVTADIGASNGIVHAIDRVLIPAR